MSIRINEKKRNISQDINKRNIVFEYTILYDLYKKEFIDYCEDILIKKENEFLTNFYKRMELIFKNSYGETIVENNKEFKNLILKCRNSFYTEIYKKMFDYCQSTIRQYNMNKKSKDISYLVNFRTHCFSNQIAYHTCKSKFLVSYDDKNKNKILYVICSECKKCYYENSILMYCPSCKKEFYSLTITLLDKILPPATWEKYHCNSLRNEQMSCIKCGDKFYLKHQFLFCKKCKFTINPLDIIWKCLFCKNDFKSFAKIYNPLENKLIDICIKNAILEKEIVKPKQMGCGCFKNNEIEKNNFYHKINECNGVLYKGILSGKNIMVCSECKSIININKFYWNCSKCNNNFICKEIITMKQKEKEEENNIEKNNYNDFKLKKYNNLVNNSEYNGETDNTSGSNTKDVKKLNTIYYYDNKRTLLELHDRLFSSSTDKKRNLSINLINPLYIKNNSCNNSQNKRNCFIEDYNSLDYKYYNNEYQVIKYPLRMNKYFLNVEKQKINYQNAETNVDEVKNNNYNLKTSYNNFIPIKNISCYKSNQLSRNSSEIKKNDNEKNINDFSPISAIKKKSKYQSQEKNNKSVKFFDELDKEETKNYIHVRKNNNINNQYNLNLDIKVKGNNNDIKLNPNNFLKSDTKLLEYLINSAKKLKLKAQSSVSNNINIFKQILPISRNSSQDNLEEFNFDDYTILSQIGEGTFGKIYLVKDKNNKLFSMKKLLISDEIDYNNIIKEYKLCHSLKHENIVKLLGIHHHKLDKTTFAIYILMEVGKNDWEKEIKERMTSNNYYSEKELINIIKQLSSSLSFLQNNNISHRDIKPQNVLVFPNNHYKVADFGEAKKINYKNIRNTLRGTQIYMSPLLFNGLKHNKIDIKHNLFKSDIYSLGLCLLYSSTFKLGNLYEIRKISDRNSLKIFIEENLTGKYSDNFINLLLKMLEINENDRIDFIDLKKIMDNWK